MTTEDIFRRVVQALEGAGTPYMLTGSFASSFHGVPRASQGIDIVMAPTDRQLETLVKLLPSPDYYVDLEVAREARRAESMFNVIDLAAGWKVDLIIRKSRAFSREEFARRVKAVLYGQELFIASAEDVILAKLEWAKMGQSDRQIEDVSDVLRIRWGSLDERYLDLWLRELELEDQWARARKRAGV
jgi:hypothetical protein